MFIKKICLSLLLIKMANQNYKCFEEAIEKAKQARALVDYVVQGNELEALLYLSPSDYIKCLTEYSGVLDKLGSFVKERRFSVEDLNLHLKRLHNAIDLVTPLTVLLAEFSVDEFNYKGDKETGLIYLKNLTAECSKKTNGLAEELEAIVKSGYVNEVAKRKDTCQKLNEFILYCRTTRGKNAPLDGEEYEKFVRWKNQIDKLATNKNGNEELSGLIDKALIELGFVFNMHESKTKFAGEMFGISERGLRSGESKSKEDNRPKIDLKRVERWMDEI